MKDALHAYLGVVALGGDHVAGVTAAAEAVASRPWDVVHQAGKLARCRRVLAEVDLGITATLAVVKSDSRAAIARVDAGQPFPQKDVSGRRTRGAFDTPVDLARRVVASTVQACEPRPRIGLDPACGTGAFLVAMVEAGVPEVYGTDLDPAALAVAQIAAPRARVVLEDALKHGPEVDMVCGNPPYVPPERQDKLLREELRRRFPWLGGRFDLVIPFAATAAERVRKGGGLGLVLPSSALVQPYGATLRRRWVLRHRFTEISGPHPFPGASVDVMLVVVQAHTGPAPLPLMGLGHEELLRLQNVPLNPQLQPGDVDLVEHIRSNAVPLGSLATVDTGLVAHGPEGGKHLLIHDEPGEGRVPYADAREFFAGRRRWLNYATGRMHRAKSPALFESPKIVLQRIRGRGPVRAAIDRDGVYVGHTCTVVLPDGAGIPLERLLQLIRSPIVDALTRIERGQRLDLYPRDVAAFPVPRVWLQDPDVPLQDALALSPDQLDRLHTLAAR